MDGVTGLKGYSALSTELKSKIADINLDDGLSQEEVTKAGLSDEDIQAIKDAGFVVDDDIKLETGDTEETDDAGSIEELEAQKKQVEDLIKTLESDVTNIEKDIKDEQLNLDGYKRDYDKATKDLEEKENLFDKKQKELADLNAEIATVQQMEQKRYEGKISDLVTEAMNNYNPEKDGDDFDSYLNQCLSKVGIGSYSALDFTNKKARDLADETNSLLGDIKKGASNLRSIMGSIASSEKLIKNLNIKLDAKNAEIDIQNKKLTGINEKIDELSAVGTKADLTVDELWALVSPKEKELAEEVNMTEKLANGDPRYIFAQGADGKYHIYDMGQYGTAEDNSLVRLKYGYSQESFDIIPLGSGGMVWRGDTFKKLDNDAEGGRQVYFLSDCENVSTYKACYSTWSPLSFDVDGDGVHTSKETVDFDIDGDGVVDTVNNSAEWVLAFDKDGNGIAGEDGSELFGDNTDLDGDGKKDGYANGFDALRALAEKEGLIGSDDDMLDVNDLKKLQEKYGLVMTKGYGGEAKSLTDLGITEINLSKSETKLTKNFDGQNNDIMTQEGATFKVNGQTREYADIWNSKKDEASEVDFDALSFDADFDFSVGEKLIKVAESLEGVHADEKEIDADGILEAGKATGKRLKTEADRNYIPENDSVDNQEEEIEITADIDSLDDENNFDNEVSPNEDIDLSEENNTEETDINLDDIINNIKNRQ